MAVSVQQVATLVERPIEVVEYQQQSCQCAHCGQVHIAAWPQSIVPGQDLGVSLQALLVWLGNYGHLSYEKQQELLRELGDIDIGVGTLQVTNQRLFEAVHPAVNDLRDWVQQQPHVHVDESPWPVLGLKEWMWVNAGQDFCLFHAGDTRSRAELVEQLGEEFDGVLSSDDLSVYNGYPVTAQQKCLAHMRRHFKKVVQLGLVFNPVLGQVFLDLIDEAEDQHRYWRETRAGARLLYLGNAVQVTHNPKHRAVERPEPDTMQANYCARYGIKPSNGGIFKGHPEVPPDNNLAERSLRLAVTKRKVSGGSRSMQRFAQTADSQSCSANLSPTGTVGHEVFSAGSDGKVGEW